MLKKVNPWMVSIPKGGGAISGGVRWGGVRWGWGTGFVTQGKPGIIICFNKIMLNKITLFLIFINICIVTQRKKENNKYDY